MKEEGRCDTDGETKEVTLREKSIGILNEAKVIYRGIKETRKRRRECERKEGEHDGEGGRERGEGGGEGGRLVREKLTPSGLWRITSLKEITLMWSFYRSTDSLRHSLVWRNQSPSK